MTVRAGTPRSPSERPRGTTGPVFVIRAKHPGAPTYFGSYADRMRRSSVFVFGSRDFATRVAQGLEGHRRAHGRFPPPATDALHVGPDAPLGELDMLEVREARPAWLDGMRGSGVMLCRVDLDAEGQVRAGVMHDEPPTKRWMDGVYSRSLGNEADEGNAADDGKTEADDGKTEADDDGNEADDEESG